MLKIVVSISVCLGLISCHPQVKTAATDSEPRETPTITPEKRVKKPVIPSKPSEPNPEMPEEASIKDKTTFPTLATALPALLQGDWMKTKATPLQDIKKTATTRVLFRAEKSSDGTKRQIEVAFGDLLKEPDAIVNAANSTLEGGGGIDGVIHNKALVNGEDLLKKEAILYKKYHKIDAFPTGSAMATHAYGLSPLIKTIIFTVGPQGDSSAKTDLELYSAIYNSLLKANEYGAENIAFPAVSTGIYGFPLERAAELYFSAAIQFFADNPDSSIKNVRFVHLDVDRIKILGAQFEKFFKS